MKKLIKERLCAAITYEIDGELEPIYHCHCAKCRRWHSTDFKTRASVEASNVKWLLDKEHLSPYSSSANVVKRCCAICDSNLIGLYNDTVEFIGLPSGGLEHKLDNHPLADIFVGSKVPLVCNHQ